MGPSPLDKTPAVNDTGPFSVEQVLAAEAVAIHDEAKPALVAELQGFRSNQERASQRADKDADQRSGRDEERDWIKERKNFYCTLNQLNRAALCCSGGGIRSATFCLGLIQALAILPKPGKGAGTSAGASPRATSPENSLLSCFHYLSTVSGGGYIGSWLSAWRTRNDFPTVWKSLSDRPDGPDVEPAEISWLRAYSNYLTPKAGVFSADTWTGLAIYLRNLILNWLVIIPAVAAVLLVLKLIITLSVWLARYDAAWWPQLVVALVGIALLIVAQAFTTAHRPTRRKKPDTHPYQDADNVNQNTFILRGLVFSFLSAVLLTGVLASSVGVLLVGGFETHTAIFIGAGIAVPIFAAGWAFGQPLNLSSRDFAFWALSGLVYGGLLGLGAHLYAGTMPYTDGTAQSIWTILVPVILGVPWVLLSQLFAEMVFVGLISYELDSDSDREWLGRAAGWVIATAIIWIVTTFIAFAGGYFLIDYVYGKVVAPYLATAGGVAGAVTAWLGKSAKTPAQQNTGDQSIKTLAMSVGLAIAGPLFAGILVVGISVGLDLLLLENSLIDSLTHRSLDTGYIVFWLLIGFAAAFVVAWIASRSVNINRFSIHALYRNRLVRAYLGASRQRRYPDLFTGFDANDNLSAYKLWPPKCPEKGDNTYALFHVVNITLNVVKTARLAWQQRKAESFTVTPLHCGSPFKGYRHSDEYGGHKGYGLSLGTAMAISGAAASPNMGYHSSPSITLLLALFNVRLGWWLGNPGKEGKDTYMEEAPATAIRPLAEETFGLTTDKKPWVYLSDGGHFENLGLYEMVRRRCRFIVLIDAGCDPDFAFEDLGNALRKIYIDLGIRIRFAELDRLRNRPNDHELATQKAAGFSIPYHAIGTIHYSDADADGPTSKDGYIIYIKPAYHGTSDTEGAGVRSYAMAHKKFPHEPTADQWFSESQFESYRSLALDIAQTVFAGDPLMAPGLPLSQLLKDLADTTHSCQPPVSLE